MNILTWPVRGLFLFFSFLLIMPPASSANSIVWSCSRSEPKQTVFDGIRAFRLENLTARDNDTISITLLDLYGAYAGEVIQMGKLHLSVCSLPPKDPLQVSVMDLLGLTSDDLVKASKLPQSPLIFIPSIHDMQKCLNEHHPAVGFFQTVVENERVGPCF
jgi:hypothetical protein